MIRKCKFKFVIKFYLWTLFESFKTKINNFNLDLGLDSTDSINWDIWNKEITEDWIINKQWGHYFHSNWLVIWLNL